MLHWKISPEFPLVSDTWRFKHIPQAQSQSWETVWTFGDNMLSPTPPLLPLPRPQTGQCQVTQNLFGQKELSRQAEQVLLVSDSLWQTICRPAETFQPSGE